MTDELNPHQNLMLKAAQDKAFREELLTDPKATLERYLGTQLPGELNVRVVENTATELTLVIPPRFSSELSDDDLDSVSGGQSLLGFALDQAMSYVTLGVGCLVSKYGGGSVAKCRKLASLN